MFCIGASRKPDWVMNEGTGKICCPNCFEVARAEGREVIDKAMDWKLDKGQWSGFALDYCATYGGGYVRIET